MPVRFRLSTLLMIVPIVAVGLVVWLRYIRPNVAGVSLRGASVVFHMTDEYTQRKFARDPALQALLNTSEDGFALLHDSYISVPLLSLAVGLATFAALSFVIFFVARFCLR